ncbi:MAG: S9 family peptidase [Anaerolineales bacterium]|nr:S9 family peptidase [Anaerolineales bacterium]MDW8162091.1 prolyl oligopeptidase family serine peptidase [Anaerolineales bacterium]
MNKKELQYGLFPSPISPLSMARGYTLAEVAFSPLGYLLWLENRADRGVIVVQPLNGEGRRDLNSEFSVRAKVGYGGGDFAVWEEWVYFVVADQGRIYRQPLRGGQAQPLTPAFGRAASPTPSPNGKWLAYVHTYEDKDVVAIVDTAGQRWPQILAQGEDFYMQPAWHPQGRHLAWIAWNHPNMPWDGTWLRLAELEEHRGCLHCVAIETLAGDEQTSVFQPLFSPNGRHLAYVAESEDWWQIWLYDLHTRSKRQLTTFPAEHGLPAWLQGLRTFQFSPDGRWIYCVRNQNAQDRLIRISVESGAETPIELDPPYTVLGQICLGEWQGQTLVALIASAANIPPRVITAYEDGRTRVWGRAYTEEIPPEAYSVAQPIEWAGLDGETVHGLYYPPHSLSASGRGLPPLIVGVHGGPTSQVKNGFNPRAQFFATRGYAFLEVNYRGSTGYGRAYREKLRASWGLYDVQDAVSGAQACVQRGLADGEKLVILGGSAGGFTVLKALEDYPSFFKAGICLFGISNHFKLAQETHKFEARYLDHLLGPLPEAAAVYRERSPIYSVDRIRDPLAIFQGEEDAVVPRAQSDEIVESLRRRGVPHVYHVYPGEGHGFRKSETIEHFYKAVEAFLKEYVLFR